MASEPVHDSVVSTHSKSIPDTVLSDSLIPDQVKLHESDTPYESIPEEVSNASATNLNSTATPSPDAEEPSLTSILLKNLESMQEQNAALAKNCLFLVSSTRYFWITRKLRLWDRTYKTDSSSNRQLRTFLKFLQILRKIHLMLGRSRYMVHWNVIHGI